MRFFIQENLPTQANSKNTSERRVLPRRNYEIKPLVFYGPFETMEGEGPTGIVVLQFRSMDEAGRGTEVTNTKLPWSIERGPANIGSYLC